GRVLVDTADHERLVESLRAPCVGGAAGSGRGAAVAGDWFLFTGRLLRGDGLAVRAAYARHFDPGGRQRAADLNGVAVPAGAGRVSQAHGSADTTTGSCSQPWRTGQPRSSCT